MWIESLGAVGSLLADDISNFLVFEGLETPTSHLLLCFEIFSFLLIWIDFWVDGVSITILWVGFEELLIWLLLLFFGEMASIKDWIGSSSYMSFKRFPTTCGTTGGFLLGSSFNALESIWYTHFNRTENITQINLLNELPCLPHLWRAMLQKCQ